MLFDYLTECFGNLLSDEQSTVLPKTLLVVAVCASEHTFSVKASPVFHVFLQLTNVDISVGEGLCPFDPVAFLKFSFKSGGGLAWDGFGEGPISFLLVVFPFSIVDIEATKRSGYLSSSAVPFVVLEPPDVDGSI